MCRYPLPHHQDESFQTDHWGREDAVYRYSHQSFKVYWIQSLTLEIVTALKQLMPGRPLCAAFRTAVDAGDGTEIEEIVYQERDGDEIDAFVDFPWAVIEHCGPATSRYSPKRIRISVEPGDKYAGAPLEPARARSGQEA